MYWDWTYLLVIPGLLLGLWAQASVSSAYRKYGAVTTRGGITASEVAHRMLVASGNGGVALAQVQGELTDHYDPKANVLRLSTGVTNSSSVAAIGIAAHECGHAMQEGDGYAPLRLRSMLVPTVNIGSKLYFPLFLGGIVFSWEPLITAGILCFALTLVFSLVTLPVEFNASRRAVACLEQGGYVTEDELVGVKKVLRAAAMTYVAAAISSFLQLLRLLIISRNRD